MAGYQSFIKNFKHGFITSKNISKKYQLAKALSSLYIIPTFFRGVYYIPSERERKGHFIQNPRDFFYKLFDFVYGRNNWYWGLSTAARYYGKEWSATKILECVASKSSKIINFFVRSESLFKKKSYRSKILAEYLTSLEINIIYIHKGKKEFFKEIKIDGEIGPVATEQRLKKDLEFFLPRLKDKNLRQLYRKYIK